jgi:hypothetical protein
MSHGRLEAGGIALYGMLSVYACELQLGDVILLRATAQANCKTNYKCQKTQECNEYNNE